MKRKMGNMDRIYCLLMGYICGCFLTAEFVSKKYKGYDVKTYGSGNPGTANVTKKLGKKAGFLVLLGDCLKTFIPIAICRLWLFKGLSSHAVSYAGLGAVLGHCYPVFRHFRGGKGIAVTGAYSLCLYPPICLTTYSLGGLVALLSKHLVIGSGVIAILFPITTYLFGFQGEETILAVITGIIILIQHKKSFLELLKGRGRDRESEKISK